MLYSIIIGRYNAIYRGGILHMNNINDRLSIDDRLAARFICSKCGGSGAEVKRFAATGTGLSKLFDIQHNVFIAVSCRNCGYTEIYNPEILEGKDTASNILDVLFGG